MRLDQSFDARHPHGELTDLLVHFCAEAADLSLHVQELSAGLLLQGADLFLHVQELAAQRGEPERASREHRSEHGDEHRDEESFGSGERVVGTAAGPGAAPRFHACHRSALFTLSRSIGAALTFGQRDSGLRRVGGSFVHGEVLHQCSDVNRSGFFPPCGQLWKSRSEAALTVGKRQAVEPDAASGSREVAACAVPSTARAGLEAATARTGRRSKPVRCGAAPGGSGTGRISEVRDFSARVPDPLPQLRADVDELFVEVVKPYDRLLHARPLAYQYG